MKTLTELLSYIAAVGLIVAGLAAGSVWLLRSDSSMRAEAKAPVVPQKFLDSIERKKPVPVDIVAPVRGPAGSARSASVSPAAGLASTNDSGGIFACAKSKETAVGVEAP